MAENTLVLKTKSTVLNNEVYIASEVGTIVVGLLHRQFFDACALQHGNVHAIVSGVR